MLLNANHLQFSKGRADGKFYPAGKSGWADNPG